MKFVFSFVLSVLLLSFSAQAQQLFSVPDIVKQTFDKQYPDAQDLKWTNGLDNHSVRFTLGERKLKASYAPKGDWITTEEQVKMETLPEVVKLSLIHI